MKQILAHLISALTRSSKPCPVARSSTRPSLGFEDLEGRLAPSTFQSVLLPSAPVAVSLQADGTDVIVGAGPGAPGGHVKCW
jgi:hypothetical protein